MAEWVLPSTRRCGYYDCSEFSGLKRSPERRATLYEIEYFLEDAGETYLDGVPYRMRHDHVLVAHLGQVRYSQLPFRTLFLKFSAADALAALLDGLPPYFPVIHAAAAQELLRTVIAQNESRTPDEALMNGSILLLLSTLRKDARFSGGDGRSAWMVQARRYIDEHYMERVTAAEIAKSVSLSESHFRAVYRQTFGTTFHRYLTDVRVAAAKAMLWDSTIAIGTVAERSGFGSAQNLNAIFKRETGQTPSQYRQACRRNYWR